jgi:CRP-like cAMP-binding protein
MLHVYQPEQWHDFFVMVGGAAAALAGLVFVAMSLNLATIFQDAMHRFRAIGTLAGFTSVFSISALALMGGQNHVAICQMTVMENGGTLETATVGLEGASWISASIGARSMPCESVVAISGEAQALGIDDLDREMRENAHFRDVLTQYSHALLIHCMRMTGCTGLHALEQRCARWILETLDRVSADRFAITHEFLAMLLGVSRPSVSVAIEEFVRRGMLRVQRGRILIGDREQLQKVSCDCYAVIKENYQQVGR